MPIISLGYHAARREYTCSTCGLPIVKTEKYLRVYGMAANGDKPYNVYLCTCCALNSPIERITEYMTLHPECVEYCI